MKKIPGLLAGALMIAGSLYAQKKNTAGGLAAHFLHPPDSVRPYVYWYWLNNNLSPEGVVEDLKAMKAVGIGGAFIGNIGLSPEEGTPYGPVPLLSDTWWKATRAALKYASDNNISIGMFNSPGWTQSGGPWIPSEDAMQYLVADTLHVRGPQRIALTVPSAGSGRRHVASIALPAGAYGDFNIREYHPGVYSNAAVDSLERLMDGSFDAAVNLPGAPTGFRSLHLDFVFADTLTARSLVLYPAHRPFSADVELQVKRGAEMATVRTFHINRSNDNRNTGFLPYAPVSVAFDAVSSRQFRLVVKNVQGAAGLTEVQLSPRPVVENYMEKQLAKMYHAPLPLWEEYQWPAPEETGEPQQLTKAADVVNLAAFRGSDGVIRWDAPAGNWLVMHYYMTPTLVTNAPAPKEGRGLEVDKMNSAKLRNHFNAFIGKVLEQVPAQERKTFRYMVADSYETGSQNWTDSLEQAFKRQYGYDPIPWLPVLSGRVIGSADQSDRFLWDLRRIVADRVAYEYVGGLKQLGNAHGLRLWLENYGHWGYPAEFLQYGGQADEVAGEFWNEGSLGDIENRSASSAAHTYGKNRVWAESFTAGGEAFARLPYMLKRRGDWSFTEGVNQTLLHLYIHQPDNRPGPGLNAWFGTEFNRKNTWFPYAGGFIDYLRRTNFLLQQGKPVNDIAYFIGEDAPKMTGTRDPLLPSGYSFDYINAEVILHKLKVSKGYLVLPDGVQYRMLVLPPKNTMRPALLQKISELVAGGAVIMGSAPDRSPSLQDFPRADAAVKALAGRLWGGAVLQPGIRSYGKGLVMEGISMEAALQYLQLQPDFTTSDKAVLFTHRKTDDADIYFLSNQRKAPLSCTTSFRVQGAAPWWWNPVDGSTRPLPDFRVENGRTIVPVKLEAHESGFVVFRKGPAKSNTAIRENFPAATVLQTLNGPWTLRFDTSLGGPAAPQVWNELHDWCTDANEAIRYYSGPVIYESSFRLDNIPPGKIYIHLGNSQVVAKVRVNGKDCGIAWTAPWQVDVSHALQKGNNMLQVEVVNTWVNRLVEQQVPGRGNSFRAAINPYKANTPLPPSGLTDAVTLRQVEH